MVPLQQLQQQQQQQQQQMASPQPPSAAAGPAQGGDLHLQELAAALQNMEQSRMVNNDAALGGLLGTWAQQQQHQQAEQQQQAQQLLSLSQGIPHSGSSGPGLL
jgi:hypothetical protein